MSRPKTPPTERPQGKELASGDKRPDEAQFVRIEGGADVSQEGAETYLEVVETWDQDGNHGVKSLRIVAKKAKTVRRTRRKRLKPVAALADSLEALRQSQLEAARILHVSLPSENRHGDR
jgi:hypothetical protein